MSKDDERAKQAELDKHNPRPNPAPAPEATSLRQEEDAAKAEARRGHADAPQAQQVAGRVPGHLMMTDAAFDKIKQAAKQGVQAAIEAWPYAYKVKNEGAVLDDNDQKILDAGLTAAEHHEKSPTGTGGARVDAQEHDPEGPDAFVQRAANLPHVDTAGEKLSPTRKVAADADRAREEDPMLAKRNADNLADDKNSAAEAAKDGEAGKLNDGRFDANQGHHTDLDPNRPDRDRA